MSDYILNFKNFLKKVHGFLLVIWTMLLIFLILIFRQNNCVFGYGMTFSLPLNSDCILQFLTDFSNFEYFNRLSCTQDCMSTLNGFILSNILDQLKHKCNILKNFSYYYEEKQ